MISERRKRYGTPTVGPSLTDQSQAAACDVNRIVASFMKTGVMPQASGKGMYGDFSSVESFHEACNIVLRANAQFEGLDASVRKRFDNDPAKLLAFVADSKNLNEAIELGLVQKPTPSQPVSAPAGTAGQAGGNSST